MFYEEGVQKNDKKAMYKFHSESDTATELMTDLKRRVKESENNVRHLSKQLFFCR